MITKKTILKFFFLLISFFTIIKILQYKKNIQKNEKKIISQKEILVVAKNYKQKKIRIPISSFGLVKPNEESILYSQVNGKVLKVYYKRGDYFKKGQVLLEFENNKIIAELKSSNAIEKKADLEYTNAQKLYLKKHYSKAQLYSAKANLETAKSKVSSILHSLETTKIKASIDGILINKMPNEGEFINFSTKINKIIDISSLKIVFHIAEKNINKISLKDNCEIQRLGNTYKAKISHISPIADEKTRTFKCEALVLKNSNEEKTKKSMILKPNETDSIVIKTRETSLHVIPSNCLTLSTNGNLSVIVLKKEKSKKVLSSNTDYILKAKGFAINVRVLSQKDGFVYVKGLPEKCLIVIRGNNFIQSGSLVRYIEKDKNIRANI